MKGTLLVSRRGGGSICKIHLGGVDHEGHPACLGVRHQQVDKPRHGPHPLYQAVVHVYVQDVGPLLHLQGREKQAQFGVVWTHSDLLVHLLGRPRLDSNNTACNTASDVPLLSKKACKVMSSMFLEKGGGSHLQYLARITQQGRLGIDVTAAGSSE